MATTLFLNELSASTHLGTNNTRLAGAAAGWFSRIAEDTRDSQPASTLTVFTTAGPTAGLEVDDPSLTEWLSEPLDQDVTIAGSITFNLRAAESNMAANADIQCVIERVNSQGVIVSTVVNSEQDSELGTSEAARNWTATPTSTAFLKGDRIRIRVAANDQTTLVAAHTITLWFNGPTAGASGDSFVTFTETFGFLDSTDVDTSTALTLVGAGNNIAGAGNDWANPGNITADDGSNASVTNITTITDSLAGTQLGFSLPAEATIVGIEVECDVTTAGGSQNRRVSLTKDGSSAVGSERNPTAGTGVKTLGGPTDLWGTTWLEADIEASTFGVLVVIDPISTTSYSIDYVKVRVYYWLGSKLFLTDVAGPAVGAAIEKEMWTSRGDGVNSIVRNTAAGWTAPLQWTDSGGGTVVEWYSKQLQAFTLADLVRCNLRAHESNALADASLCAELATCNADGSNVTIWGTSRANADTGAGAVGELTTSEIAWSFDIAGDDLSVAAGQRLRLRVYIDDVGFSVGMVAGHTATLYYDGTSGGASGDSWIQLSQTVSEFSDVYVPRNPGVDHINPGFL